MSQPQTGIQQAGHAKANPAVVAGAAKVADKAATPVNATPKAAAKEKTEVESVKLSDGRSVGFAGKRKMVKEIIIGEGGKVSVRFDFRNGETRTFHVPASLIHQCAAHGASQKIGDETAGVEDIDDMVIAVDDIIKRLNDGEWAAAKAAGDGFSGASVVIKAIAEVSGKSAEDVKTFLQKKLDADKAAGGKLTRAALYASFRNPTTKTGIVIERLEKEKKSKNNAVDADALMAELK